jgi:hypothetical protein
LFDELERDGVSIRVARWGHIVSTGGAVPWLVVDPDDVPVAPVRRFLTDFVARGNRPGSVRSYPDDLLRWCRWLRAVGVEWDKVVSLDGMRKRQQTSPVDLGIPVIYDPG